MKKNVQGLCVAICCAALFAGGCAKTEVVKKDEGVAPQAKPAVTTPAPAKTEAPKAAPAAKETTAPKAAATAQPAAPSSASLLQAELNKIYFDFDSSALSSAARAGLAKNADLLKKNADGKITIEGHCDERGSDEYNIALGERRAKAAQKYLTTLGIPTGRLSVVSYGKEKPADQGHDEAAWAKNRRDEFVVSK